MIDVVIGLTSIAIISLAVLRVAVAFPEVARILWLAFILRVVASLIHFFVVPLPDSGADAATFERLAWEFAKDGLYPALLNFTGPHHNFISWFISLFYAVFDRSFLLAQSISVFFGTGAVFLGWLVSRELWHNKAAQKAAFVMAVFPIHILYSALPLREAYIVFGILLGIYGLIKIYEKFSLFDLFLSISGFLLASFFHGVLFLSFIFVAFVLLRSFVKGKFSRLSIKVKAFLLALFVAILGHVMSSYGSKVEIPYIGTIEHIDVKHISDKIIHRTSTTTENGANYPRWTVPENTFDMAYLLPVRVLYFLYSPFAWDIKKYKHFLGYLDSLLYVLFSVFVVASWPYIKHNKKALIIVFFVIFFIIIFSYGVGNFGTGIRHRSKFVFLIIALSGPVIRRFKIR